MVYHWGWSIQKASNRPASRGGRKAAEQSVALGAAGRVVSEINVVRRGPVNGGVRHGRNYGVVWHTAVPLPLPLIHTPNTSLPAIFILCAGTFGGWSRPWRGFGGTAVGRDNVPTMRNGKLVKYRFSGAG